ncbi:MAG: GIY-YIG nuclease family protein [Clostridia bacterium]|nr:GIY-YIG nuclease family protein [Clostridia bacterium]
MNYTYILRCCDGTLYTGWTNDLKARVQTHNSGKGARYTRCRLPVTLVYYESFETRKEAMRREYQIKRLPRTEKLKLIEKANIKDSQRLPR